MKCKEDCLKCPYKDCILDKKPKKFYPKEVPHIEYGEWLRNKRISYHLTQQELADISGMSVCSIKNYENEVHSPSLNAMEILFSVFGGRLVIEEGDRNDRESAENN